MSRNSASTRNFGKTLVSVKDFETEAINIIPRDHWGYFSSGSMHEVTLKENKSAMHRWYIRPRLFKNVSSMDLSTTVLGHKLGMPIGVAPTAVQVLAHPDAEKASAKATGKYDAVFTASFFSSVSLENIANSSPNTLRFFNIYLLRDRDMLMDAMRRAEIAGYKAFVLTCDSPVYGNHLRLSRHHFHIGTKYPVPNINAEDDMPGTAKLYTTESSNKRLPPSNTWDDVKWLTRQTKLPVILKGILTAEDARLGVQAGAAAIWVSNHGGRQLDHVPPTMEVLRDIVKEVGEDCEVFVDGGFTTGTDVFKAIALGAKMVFIGRPILWGLACGGQAGVERVLQLLRAELQNTMALAGCSSLKEVTNGFVQRKCSCQQEISN